MLKAQKPDQKPEERTEDNDDGIFQSSEGNRPDYFIRQYRSIRSESGTKTRKETVGAIWRNASNGMLTIRFDGVQVISNDVFAHPVTYDFNS